MEEKIDCIIQQNKVIILLSQVILMSLGLNETKIKKVMQDIKRQLENDDTNEIEKLLKDYKQDKKIIQEMVNYIKNEWGFANNDEVIDYFRKRCKQ